MHTAYLYARHIGAYAHGLFSGFGECIVSAQEGCRDVNLGIYEIIITGLS